MKVGVNLCWLVPGDVGGSEQALTRALRALADHGDADIEDADIEDADIEIVLFVLKGFIDSHPDLVDRFETHVMPISGPISSPGRGRAARAMGKPLRVAGEHLWLPAAVRGAAVDVLHDAGGSSPGRVDIPRILGIHDTQPLDIPRNFHPVKVAWLRRSLPIAVANATVITVPSEFVRDRMVDTFAVDDDRIVVVPWSVPDAGAPDEERIAELRADYDLPGPVVLQAAITYPHKDHVTTIAAFDRIAGRHPDARLVLAGGVGPAEDTVLDAIAHAGARNRIVRTGRLDDAQIAALMATARVVVVPSRYEGFGIPALEAMVAGTPVIVADAASLPEVVGDAGVIVSPGDDAQLAVELHHALVDGDAGDERIAAGRARASSFTAERTAATLLSAYRAAAGGPAYRSGPTGR